MFMVFLMQSGDEILKLREQKRNIDKTEASDSKNKKIS